MFDLTKGSIAQRNEDWLEEFLADAPITEAELDDIFDLHREQLADEDWIQYMPEYEYNRFCCACEGGF